MKNENLEMKNSAPLGNNESVDKIKELKIRKEIDDILTYGRINEDKRIEAKAKLDADNRLKVLKAKGKTRRRAAGAILGVLAVTGTISGAVSIADYFKQRNISKDISNRADGYTVEEIMESPIIDYITPNLACTSDTIESYLTALEKYESLKDNPNAKKLGTQEATVLAESAEFIQFFTKNLLPSAYTQAIKENVALGVNLNTFENQSYVRDSDIIHHYDISINNSRVDNEPYISIDANIPNSYSFNCGYLSNDIPLSYKTAVNDVMEITGNNATDNLSLEECVEYGNNFKGLLCTNLIVDSKGNLREVDSETFKEHARSVRSELGEHYEISYTNTNEPQANTDLENER